MWQSQSQAHIISKIFTSQWYSRDTQNNISYYLLQYANGQTLLLNRSFVFDCGSLRICSGTKEMAQWLKQWVIFLKTGVLFTAPIMRLTATFSSSFQWSITQSWPLWAANEQYKNLCAKHIYVSNFSLFFLI